MQNSYSLAKELAKGCKSVDDTLQVISETEMGQHLGHEKHFSVGVNTGNSRNGYSKKMRKVFLDYLPKTSYGTSNTKYYWNECNGYVVKFVYDDIEGELLLLNYDQGSHKITFKYLNKTYSLHTNMIRNCNLGGIVGKKVNSFRYKTNDIVQQNYGRLQITKVFKTFRKKYQYRCLNCSNKDTISESDLMLGKGCNVCIPSPKKVLAGYNDIATTKPWMVKYLVDKEDAQKYTYNSTKKIWFKCLECGEPKYMKITEFYSHGLGCNKCSEGISYPNKLAYSLLSQLGIDFIPEKRFDWCVFEKFDLSGTQIGIYDYYFLADGKEYLLEMDGEFHSKGKFGRDTKEMNYIDDMKNKLAQEHNISIIRINCHPNELEHIKVGLINSRLKDIFDLSKIDWYECNKFALSSRVKEVCKIWNEGINNVTEIFKLTKLSKATIREYLKRGTKMNWCVYDPKLELAKRSCRNNKLNLSKAVVCKETGQQFKSASECCRVSEKVFGEKYTQGLISHSCRTGRAYKGFHFEYLPQ